MTKVVDFRARPNTDPFMSIYENAVRDPWGKFRTQKPPTETLEAYLARLKAVGVTTGVFTGRQGVLAGEFPISNDYIADCAAASDGAIVGIAGIDPRDTSAAVREIDRILGDLGLRGLTFDPPSPINGTGPSWDDEDMMFPLYAKAAERNVPVVVTMGPVVGRHGTPDRIDRVAQAFPDLTIVCSHGIWPNTSDLVALAFRRPNVVLETSIYFNYPGAQATLVEAANDLIQDQIVYASAFPFLPLETLDVFTALDLTDEAREAVLWRNADRILGGLQ